MNESLTVVTVEVTQEDIDETNTTREAAERAMKRYLLEGTPFGVDFPALWIWSIPGEEKHARFSFPLLVKSHMRWGYPYAFTFKLSLPTAALRQSAIPAQETPDATPKN